MRLRHRIKPNWRQALLPARLRVDEIGAALGSVVVRAESLALETDAMNHPGLEVGDQQLLVPAVIGDVAERGAGIGPSLKRDGGKQSRLIAVRGVQSIDRAGTAGPEHAGHPA